MRWWLWEEPGAGTGCFAWMGFKSLICHHMGVRFNNITRGLFPVTQEGVELGHRRKSAKCKES